MCVCLCCVQALTRQHGGEVAWYATGAVRAAWVGAECVWGGGGVVCGGEAGECCVNPGGRDTI